MSTKNRQNSYNLEDNELSIHRPGWIQGDLRAYQHLHRFGTIKGAHFVRTKGFATVEDLNFFENGGYGGGRD